MSGLDYGEWAQCIAFASNKYAKDYIRKSVNLFTSIEKINETYQMNLFLSLKEAIKYYFKNIEEKRELLTMITKSVVYPKVQDMETFERMVEQKDRQIKEIIQDKDLAIAERDSVIADMGSVIADQDSVIADKDVTIDRLTSELNRLKKNNVI